MTIHSLSDERTPCARSASSAAKISFSCSVRSPFLARSIIAFRLLSLSALARLVIQYRVWIHQAAEKMGGGTNDRKSHVGLTVVLLLVDIWLAAHVDVDVGKKSCDD